MKTSRIKPNSNHGHSNACKTWRLLLVACGLTALCLHAQAQSYVLTQAWRDTTNNLPGADITGGTLNNNRSLAYSAVSNIVFVANKGITGSATTPAIDALNGTNGAFLGRANVTGLNVGAFYLNEIAVADDGALYGGNLTTTLPSPAYDLYMWTNWTTAPVRVYSGDPTFGLINSPVKRMGDTLAITGSGTNTLILVAVTISSDFYCTTNVVLFSTTNGTAFTPTLLEISGMPVPTGNGTAVAAGVAFYTNNTFLYNPNSASTYLIQFPANFASQASPVAATNLLTTTFGGTAVYFSYNAGAGLLATLGSVLNTAGAVVPIDLYQLPPFADLSTPLAASSSLVATIAGANQLGGVALGGVGYSNYIYALDVNNGVIAENIVYVPPASPPVISSLTVSGEPTGAQILFPSLTPVTFAVTAVGTQPLSYQWCFNTVSNVLTATPIANATNSSYVNSNLSVSSSGWYDVVLTNAGGAVTSAALQLTVSAPLTNASYFSNLWSLPSTSRPYLDTNASPFSRGVAFDTNTMTVLVADHDPSYTGIYVLNATNGNDLFAMNTLGIGVTGNTYNLDQVGVGDDGVVYACNLYDTAATLDSFAIFSWSSVSASANPAYAYSPSDPSLTGIRDRWGDTMAVRGAGLNTEILLGTSSSIGGPSTNAALLTTTDSADFTSMVLTITNAGGIPANFSAAGICFGAGNTFWAKSPGHDMYEIAFDPATGNCHILLDLPYGSSANSDFSSMGAICLDPVNNILAGVVFSDLPNDLAVYQLYGTPAATLAVPPLLVDQGIFLPVYTSDGNNVGSATIKAGYIFGLDGANGITALTYGPPPSPTLPAPTPPSISSITTSTAPAGATLFAPPTVLTFTVTTGLNYLPVLSYQWQFNSVSNVLTAGNIANATNASYAIASYGSASGWYDVLVSNSAGSVTSAAVQLSLSLPVSSSYFSNIWSLVPGSRPYLANDSNTRGLAFDTNTMSLLVANLGSAAFGIYVLDTNGNDLFALNTLGIGTSGNTFNLDQVGVADDGVVYACNLYTTASTLNTFTIFSWPSVSASANPAYAYGPGDPSLTGVRDRWGDTMAVRGAGVNTEILLGTWNNTGGPSTNAALLTTPDGASFNSMPLLITNAGGVPANFSALGICFGAGNTFWAKSPGVANLYEIAFDPATGNCDLLLALPAGSSAESVFSSMGAIAVDPVNNILAGIAYKDVPNDVAVYQLYGTPAAPLGIPPLLVDQSLFQTENANGNNVGVTTIKAGYIFGLDLNNGITALAYTPPSTPPSPPYSITAIVNQAGTGVTVTWQSYAGADYQLQYASALTNKVWTSLSPTLTATNSTMSFTDSNPSGAARFYRVVSP